jgi:hypothetical protein
MNTTVHIKLLIIPIYIGAVFVKGSIMVFGTHELSIVQTVTGADISKRPLWHTYPGSRPPRM